MDINIYSVNGSNSTPVAVIDSRELAQQYCLKYLTTATVFHRRLPMLSREGFKCLKIHGFSPVPGSTHINICHQKNNHIYMLYYQCTGCLKNVLSWKNGHKIEEEMTEKMKPKVISSSIF